MKKPVCSTYIEKRKSHCPLCLVLNVGSLQCPLCSILTVGSLKCPLWSVSNVGSLKCALRFGFEHWESGNPTKSANDEKDYAYIRARGQRDIRPTDVQEVSEILGLQTCKRSARY